MGIYRPSSSAAKIIRKDFYGVTWASANNGICNTQVASGEGYGYVTVPLGKKWRVLGYPSQWTYQDSLSARLGLSNTNCRVTASMLTPAQVRLVAIHPDGGALTTTLSNRDANQAPSQVPGWSESYGYPTNGSHAVNVEICQRPTKGTLTYQGWPAEALRVTGDGTNNGRITVSIHPFVCKTGVSNAYTDVGGTNSNGAVSVYSRLAVSPNGRWLAYLDYATTLRVHEINNDLTINTTAASTASPGVSSSGGSTGVSFSPDGTKLAVYGSTSPYLKVYPFTNSNGTLGTVYSNPGTLPEGTVYGVEWGTGSDFLIYNCSTTPFIGGYPITTAFGTKFSNPGTIPTQTTQYTTVQRSSAGNYFAVPDNSTIRVYTANSSGFTAHASSGGAASVTSAVGWSWDGTMIGWASGGGSAYAGHHTWNGSSLSAGSLSQVYDHTNMSASVIEWAPDWPELNSNQFYIFGVQLAVNASVRTWQPRIAPAYLGVNGITYEYQLLSKVMPQADVTVTGVINQGHYVGGTRLFPLTTGNSYATPRVSLLFEETSE